MQVKNKNNNQSKRAERSRNEIIEITCRICTDKQTAHAHSYCWRHKVCSNCANKEYARAEN